MAIMSSRVHIVVTGGLVFVTGHRGALGDIRGVVLVVIHLASVPPEWVPRAESMEPFRALSAGCCSPGPPDGDANDAHPLERLGRDVHRGLSSETMVSR